MIRHIEREEVAKLLEAQKDFMYEILGEIYLRRGKEYRKCFLEEKELFYKYKEHWKAMRTYFEGVEKYKLEEEQMNSIRDAIKSIEACIHKSKEQKFNSYDELLRLLQTLPDRELEYLEEQIRLLRAAVHICDRLRVKQEVKS